MYAGHGDSGEFILTFAEEHELDLDNLPTHVELPENILLAPLALCQVVVRSDDAIDNCHRGVYGRLPGGTVVVVLVGQTFSLESFTDEGYNVRIILDPFLESDLFVVNDVNLTLLDTEQPLWTRRGI